MSKNVKLQAIPEAVNHKKLFEANARNHDEGRLFA
jgi:hypothetical protein